MERDSQIDNAWKVVGAEDREGAQLQIHGYVVRSYKVLRLPKTLIIQGNVFVLNHHSKKVNNS